MVNATLNAMRASAIRFAIVACLAALAAAAPSTLARAQDPADARNEPVREGRLYNLTSQPLSFQLHQADGAAWTESYTLPAGKFFAVRAPRPGEVTDIQGLTGNGKGFVIIRYPEPVLGGYLTLRLPAQNPANQQLQPTWYAVKDANGIIRMVQEPSIEQARAVQEKLRKQAPLTPQELERTKHMLRANWVLTD